MRNCRKALFAYAANLAFLLTSELAWAHGVPATLPAMGAYNETHPYQARLVCERTNTSILAANLFDIASGTRVRISTFNSGNVGACEFAVRASRNNTVCIESNSGYGAYNLRTRTIGQQFGSDFEACTKFTRQTAPLRTNPGYVEFIAKTEMEPFLRALPRIDSAEYDAVLKNPMTMWYDEASLTFVYQDSFGDPRGLRGNRVGFDVGSTSEEVPDIHLLVDYFNPGKFKFPFSVAAGADFAQNVYVLNFWLPPQKNGQVLPVKIWQNNSHWQWVFPAGTYIGEALFIRAPDDGAWRPFEIRARKRAMDHWDTTVWRPFSTATQLSTAVKALRPNWQQTDVKLLVTALENPATLVPQTLSTAPYTAAVPNFVGAADVLPATTDVALIKALLTDFPFTRANGLEWKRSGGLVAYAASSNSDFHIVPKGYIGGMFEVSDTSCHRCHDQTSRPLNNLDGRIVLYGEIWGEDEIFTWHPFLIDFDTFSVADGNRYINPRMQQAGLVQRGGEPAAGDPQYRALPKPFTPEYE